MTTERLDPREAHFERELDRHNSIGDGYEEDGYGTEGLGGFKHGPDDAVAHLKQMPEHLAVEKAREWTGREDIETLDEAIAAVEEELGASGG